MSAEARQLISKLGLVPLPGEGGFFAPTWTSGTTLPGGRPTGSAILFLITREGFSALHRLGVDEIWHFHAGDPVELVLIDPAGGTLTSRVLGPDPCGAHAPHAVVPAGVWQGARLLAANRGWALLGCTLSPAWDEREFELGARETLLRDFPLHAASIFALTR
jgi:predicted cupin superfamily sugar epimerase